MKKLLLVSFSFVLTLMLATSVFAKSYDVTEFYGGNGLIGRNTSYQTGDVLNIKNDITQNNSYSNTVLGGYSDDYSKITINGNGNTIDGGGYGGFKMTHYNSGNSREATIKNATLTNFSDSEVGLINIEGAYYDDEVVKLTLSDVNLIDNDGGIDAAWGTELNIVSNGTVEISSNAYIHSNGILNFKGKNINISSTTLDISGEAYNSSNLTTDIGSEINIIGYFENNSNIVANDYIHFISKKGGNVYKAVAVGSWKPWASLYNYKTLTSNEGIDGDGYIYNFGTINLGGNNEDFSGDVVVENGTINLLADSTYFNGDCWHIYAGKNTLNLINDTIDEEVRMAYLELSKTTINMNIDVDLEEATGDYLNVEDIYNNDYPSPQRSNSKYAVDYLEPISKIMIDKINILADSPDEEEVSVTIANEVPQEYIHLARNKAYSKYYGYNVKISSSGSTPTYDACKVVAADSGSAQEVDYGNVLTFSRIDDKARNPEILQAKVAVAGSNISQDEIFTTVFNNAGNYTFFQKQGTAAGDVEDRAAPTLWVKAFGSKEDVDLEDYTTVETTYYGAVVGLDWDRQYTDNFDATYGVFASYIGGKLKDDDWDNEVDQSGGYIGVRGNWYIGKLFFNGIIDYALIQNTADTVEDSNDFNSQVAGLAARVGYNFEVANKSFTIQPNLGVTGKYIMTDDYDTTVDGDKVKLSIDNITNITIEPGLKLVKNLGKCWILTGEGKYVIENVSGEVTADEIVLPDTSYDNFANVGLGIEKIWGYTVLNLKANKTFGGRDGYIINAGIEFKF